jgi:hypothetical protein
MTVLSRFALTMCILSCTALSAFPAPQERLSLWEQVVLRFLDLYRGETVRYFDATVDLNDDGKEEVVVYIVGEKWCDSGGCPMLVLTPDGSSYRLVTKTTITNTPIRVLDTSSFGWRDLGVWVSGGPYPGYEAELSFDGKSYPLNPTVPPAHHTEPTVSGKVLIPRLNPADPGKFLIGS